MMESENFNECDTNPESKQRNVDIAAFLCLLVWYKLSNLT